MKSVDRSFSIDCTDLNNLKNFSKNIHLALGKPYIGPKKNEINSLKLRRSIFAIKDINKGEKFSKTTLDLIGQKLV